MLNVLSLLLLQPFMRFCKANVGCHPSCCEGSPNQLGWDLQCHVFYCLIVVYSVHKRREVLHATACQACFVCDTDLFQIMACLHIGCSEIAYFPVLFSSRF